MRDRFTAVSPQTRRDSSVLPAPFPQYLSSPALGINNYGAVVGNTFINGSSGIQAYVGSLNSLSPISPVGPWTALYSADDINNSGQIVGWGNIGSSTEVYLRSTDGSLHMVPMPTGLVYANNLPLRLNDFGQVVGIARDSPGYAYVFTGDANGTTVISPFMGGRPAINNLGQIVSGSNLWSSGTGLQDLNSLVPGGWLISHADGINDNGQIVAHALNLTTQFSSIVILNPISAVPSAVPEPSSGILFGLALTSLAAIRIAKRR